MSTFRVFGGRVLRIVEYGLKRLLGKPRIPAKLVQRLPTIVARLPSRQSFAPGRTFFQQLWRASRAGGRSHVRAFSMGVWNQQGRRFGRSPAFGPAAALAWARSCDSEPALENVRKLFRASVRQRNVAYPRSLAGYDIKSFISSGCNAAVYEARINAMPQHGPEGRFGAIDGSSTYGSKLCTDLVETARESSVDDGTLGRRKEYPLAIKVMFNYDFHANSDHIVREMGQELVPVLDRTAVSELKNRPLYVNSVGEHANVTRMYTAFVDEMPLLSRAEELYPEALPSQLYVEDVPRSRTLFIVMKRYKMTLREYLLQYESSVRTGVVLLGQLLEALVFLSARLISHRDLKSNNILVDFNAPGETPHLVLSDFGSCLADGTFHLHYPNAEYTDLGGNLALRPPEIKCAAPGPNTILDFAKADLWGAGTLAYELFTKINPFYKRLDSQTYVERHLPTLPLEVPRPVRLLVMKLLRRNPRKRPSCASAGNVVALSLFRTDSFVTLLRLLGMKVASSALSLKISDAVALYAAETLLLQTDSEISKAELALRATFLGRLDTAELYEAMGFFLVETEEDPELIGDEV